VLLIEKGIAARQAGEDFEPLPLRAGGDIDRA
jgi:hypothetical protein